MSELVASYPMGCRGITEESSQPLVEPAAITVADFRNGSRVVTCPFLGPDNICGVAKFLGSETPRTCFRLAPVSGTAFGRRIDIPAPRLVLPPNQPKDDLTRCLTPSGELVVNLFNHLIVKSPRWSEDQGPRKLTPSENAILGGLMVNHGQAVEDEEFERILSEMLGYTSKSDSHGISVHIRRIKLKLEDTDPALLIQRIRSVGYYIPRLGEETTSQ